MRGELAFPTESCFGERGVGELIIEWLRADEDMGDAGVGRRRWEGGKMESGRGH